MKAYTDSGLVEGEPKVVCTKTDCKEIKLPNGLHLLKDLCKIIERYYNNLSLDIC